MQGRCWPASPSRCGSCPWGGADPGGLGGQAGAAPGGHQGAVQQQAPLFPGGGEGVGQAGGRCGEGIDALVDVAAGGLGADPEVASELFKGVALGEEGQQHECLAPRRQARQIPPASSLRAAVRFSRQETRSEGTSSVARKVTGEAPCVARRLTFHATSRGFVALRVPPSPEPGTMRFAQPHAGNSSG